jgi:NAD(P)-dependent dehydrogenase (short-subunit alcohol dehydrogenase family)
MREGSNVRLKDRIVVVTGASSGIGRATAERLAEEGAIVIACDRNQPEPYGAAGIEHRPLEVTDLDAWSRLAEEIRQEHGRLDVLVNNAGVVQYEGIVDIDLETWRRVLDINLNGVFYGMRTMIPLMQEKGGSIVNFSSIWGIAGAAGAAAYQASKGAVRTLTKNAAVTYAGDAIRVNSVHPGLVMTPLIEAQDPDLTEMARVATPLGRGADPREIADGVLFLAGEESSFMTGAELVLDGGYLAV